ncbi:MAG: ribbon-helix-helix domain-containing protein [Alphaproteobacteria bacterium]|jgi:predicted DNA-binding ribbon-helix-helix protein
MLVSRNVTIGPLRTSMRLEPEFWNALGEIVQREQLTLDALCTRVDAERGEHSRTAAMRLFAVAYFMADGDSR